MSQEYSKHYGGIWRAFHNPSDPALFKNVAKCNWNAGKPFRIRYGGRIGWGIRESIQDICHVVSELQSEGYDINLEIYTDQSKGLNNNIENKVGIKIKDPVAYKSLPEGLASADLLLICYDWDARSTSRARFSMPTKATEFMASGTPILVYAPPNLAVTQYALEEGWAYVVSEHSLSALKAAIIRLAKDENLRQRIGCRAMEVAARNHDAKKVREEFRQAFVEAINQRNDFKSDSAGYL
jgi:glycosyltransferase involved in cell wall biosynthesis